MRSTVILVLMILLSASLAAQSAPFGLTQRTVVNSLNFPLDDPAVVGGTGDPIELVRAFPNLTFNQPVLLTAPQDGTNRLFVLEKPGVIKVFQNTDSASSAAVFLDISSRVDQAGEQGLLGLAFDPDFATNRYFYIYYSALGGVRRSVVSRFRVTSGNPNLADAASESVVIQIPQNPSDSNHKGGMIAFGRDGMLYIGTGDGGGGGDSPNNAQNCSNMLGDMLRIDPRSATPYAIPSDNPYPAGGSYSCGRGANALQNAGTQLCGQGGTAGNLICREIYANGLRNPWRWSVDRVTGTIWIGDVGQNVYEEVDILQKGANYGWRILEGNHNYNNPSNYPQSDFRAPVVEYSHSLGSAITGGYVYRGGSIPELVGKYVYGDSGSGRIWVLDYDGTNVVTNRQLSVSLANLATFGEDQDGELYGVNLYAGTIHRFRRGSGATGPTIPPRLSQTGIFQSLASLTPNPGIIEYDVNAPLWSDYALKRRWIALPGTATIQFDPSEAFNFPTGTTLIKHFALQTSAAQIEKLETRVFFKHNQGWTGYTYKWNDAQTDADLLTAGATETIQINDNSVPGGARTQNWSYPGRAACFSCHTSQAGTVLGVRTLQLNRNFNYSGTIDNQLRAWNHIGLFAADIGAAGSFDAYSQYGDDTKSIQTRARAYLAANCAHCHQPGIIRSGEVDMRYSTLNAAMSLIGIAPSYGDLGINGALRVKVGNKSQSVLWQRIARTDEFRMPLLASSIVDPTAVDLLGSWIDVVLADSSAPAAPGNLTAQ
ncbi:MAG: PQQ-dependent sugar dehydrogenase [Oligoflexia bacterium]|nr:PQQ-dependent sugar dehydrogenase [Oligoflexia bacterium]